MPKPNQKMIILNVLLFMTQLLFIEVTFQLNLKLKLMPEVVSSMCDRVDENLKKK